MVEGFFLSPTTVLQNGRIISAPAGIVVDSIEIMQGGGLFLP